MYNLEPIYLLPQSIPTIYRKLEESVWKSRFRPPCLGSYSGNYTGCYSIYSSDFVWTSCGIIFFLSCALAENPNSLNMIIYCRRPRLVDVFCRYIFFSLYVCVYVHTFNFNFFAIFKNWGFFHINISMSTFSFVKNESTGWSCTPAWPWWAEVEQWPPPTGLALSLPAYRHLKLQLLI